MFHLFSISGTRHFFSRAAREARKQRREDRLRMADLELLLGENERLQFRVRDLVSDNAILRLDLERAVAVNERDHQRVLAEKQRYVTEAVQAEQGIKRSPADRFDELLSRSE